MASIRKLRAWRTELGISGLEIARLSGINYSSLSLFETLNAKPTDRQLDAIRGALQTAIGMRIKKLNRIVQKLTATDQESGIGASHPGQTECSAQEL